MGVGAKKGKAWRGGGRGKLGGGLRGGPAGLQIGAAADWGRRAPIQTRVAGRGRASGVGGMTGKEGGETHVGGASQGGCINRLPKT